MGLERNIIGLRDENGEIETRSDCSSLQAECESQVQTIRNQNIEEERMELETLTLRDHIGHADDYRYLHGPKTH